MSPVASNWISSFQPSCAGPGSGPYTKNWSPEDSRPSRSLSEKCTGYTEPSSTAISFALSFNKGRMSKLEVQIVTVETEVFEVMQRRWVVPDVITYSTVTSACEKR